MTFSYLADRKLSHHFFIAGIVGVLFFSVSGNVLVAHASVYVPNIQALFHFNSSTLTDSSGNGYDGTNNGATFNTTSSKLGAGAVSFNTTNDFQAPSSTWAMQATDSSVGFWVYPRANFNVPNFVSKDVGPGTNPKGALSDNVGCVNGLEAWEQAPNV